MDTNKFKVYLGLVVLAFAALMTLLALLFFQPTLEESDGLVGPCSPQTMERSCYTMAWDACRSVWTQNEELCETEIRERLGPNQATALIGPSVKWCIQKKFDKMVHSMRKLDGSDRCLEYFKKLDAPTP